MSTAPKRQICDGGCGSYVTEKQGFTDLEVWVNDPKAVEQHEPYWDNDIAICPACESKVTVADLKKIVLEKCAAQQGEEE